MISSTEILFLRRLQTVAGEEEKLKPFACNIQSRVVEGPMFFSGQSRTRPIRLDFRLTRLPEAEPRLAVR